MAPGGEETDIGLTLGAQDSLGPVPPSSGCGFQLGYSCPSLCRRGWHDVCAGRLRWNHTAPWGPHPPL